MTRKYKKHIPTIPKEEKVKKSKFVNEQTTTIRIPLRLKSLIQDVIKQNGGVQKIQKP